jgi:hypothetical protein
VVLAVLAVAEALLARLVTFVRLASCPGTGMTEFTVRSSPETDEDTPGRDRERTPPILSGRVVLTVKLVVIDEIEYAFPQGFVADQDGFKKPAF